MTTNTAAVFESAESKTLVVKEVPYPTPGADEIVVNVRAVAVNPIDSYAQSNPSFVPHWPAILGHDVSGVVTAVGKGVSTFNEGDRVLALARGCLAEDSRQGGVQQYVVLSQWLVSKIPNSLSFTDACVLPLGAATATAGLFYAGYLALDLPQVPRPKHHDTTVLVWGAASSVGSNAVQLAVAAGYDVVATASPHNFDKILKLGASQVFDYKKDSTIDDIIAALKGKTLAGTFVATSGVTESSKIVAASNGSKFIASSFFVPPDVAPGVEAKWIQVKPEGNNAVFQHIFNDFLSHALSEGEYASFPPADVVGSSLDAFQAATEELAKGVSAKKLVVTL